jgi:hypothetical protein
MPSTDSRYKTATQDIWQHYERNDDWTSEYLYVTYLNLLKAEDTQFVRFIEELVHPIVRAEEDVIVYVDLINKYIERDGYKLVVIEELSGCPLYKCIKLMGGVKENVKNDLYKRLLKSLDSDPEQKLFSTYYKYFTKEFGDKINPQVHFGRNLNKYYGADKIIQQERKKAGRKHKN